MDDIKYMAHMLEEIRDEIKAVHELVEDVPKRWEFNGLLRDVDGLKQNMSVVKVAIADLSQDVKAIKAGVADNSRDVAKQEHRIARLEAAKAA